MYLAPINHPTTNIDMLDANVGRTDGSECENRLFPNRLFSVPDGATRDVENGWRIAETGLGAAQGRKMQLATAYTCRRVYFYLFIFWIFFSSLFFSKIVTINREFSVYSKIWNLSDLFEYFRSSIWRRFVLKEQAPKVKIGSVVWALLERNVKIKRFSSYGV